MPKGAIDHEKEIARKIRDGRGVGEGSAYKPWIRIREISSLGRSHIIPGLKTGRDHHLLSDLEFRFFLLAEFSDTITDIREQFPLFSREEVVHLASSLHIKHPKYPGTSIPAVLSTDFVLTGPSVPHGVMARSIKYSDDLSNSRVLAKLQLEERYWAHRGIDWRLVTERDIPATLFKNVQWLRRGAGEDFSAPLLDALVTALLSQRKSRDLGPGTALGAVEGGPLLEGAAGYDALVSKGLVDAGMTGIVGRGGKMG